MRWLVTLAVATGAVTLAAFVWIVLEHRAQPGLSESPRGAWDTEDGLSLQVVVRRAGAERRILLRSGSGAATLVLEDAEGAGMVAFGRGRFEPGDRALGAAFLADVARWLGRDVPPLPREEGELEPFPISYAILGNEGGTEANKLFLESGNRYAEVFVNLDGSGRRAVLLEKDEEYRGDLLALLAQALRDGPPPRRKAANDPHLASDAPLVAGLRRLDCDGKFRIGTWTARGFLGVVGKGPTHLVAWPGSASAPLDVATLDGVVVAPQASATGDRVGAILVHPKEPGSYSTADPADLVVVDVASGAVRTLARSEPAFGLTSLSPVAFSPLGDRLATSASVDSKPPVRSRVRVYDSVSGAQLFETDPALDLDVHRWDADGLVLYRGEFDEDFNYQQTWFRWIPGESVPAEAGNPPWRSPDGRYAIAGLPDGNLEVRGPAGVRTYAPSDNEEREVFRHPEEFAPTWLGPRGLLVPGVDLLLLDLETLKLRHVFPERGWSFVAAEPVGRNVLAVDALGRPHWGEVR